MRQPATICIEESRRRAFRDAAARFGWLGMFVGLDLTASSVQTQERLGWPPTGPGLIADLDRMCYFVAEQTLRHLTA